MDDEINLKEYITVVMKNWKLIVIIALVFATLAFILSTQQKSVYQAKATMLVQGGAGAKGGGSAGGLAAYASLAGINLSGASVGSYDIKSLLKSRMVAKRVVEGLDLKNKIEGWKSPLIKEDDMAMAVSGMIKQIKSSGGIIELIVEYGDPNLSAEIANGFVDALTFVWNQLNYTEAQKQREYIENQLPRVEKELKKTERRLKDYTLLISSFGDFSSERSGGIEIDRLRRELEIHSSVYKMLRSQYESVKLEEAKKIVPFSMLDKARVPGGPINNKKKTKVMMGLVFGIFVGLFIAFGKEYWNRSWRGK